MSTRSFYGGSLRDPNRRSRSDPNRRSRSDPNRSSRANLNVKEMLARPTYLIFGELNGLPRKDLRENIESHGFKEASTPVTNYDIRAVTLVWTSQDTSGHFAPISYKIPCLIKNVLDIDSYSNIANKRELHKFMEERDPAIYNRYFAESSALSNFKFPQCDGARSRRCPVYILRPAKIGYFSGKGIQRVSSARELEDAKEFYRTKEKVSPEDVLVSEYLDEPYLFEGRKFHLRMYLLICLAPDGLRWNLWGDEEARASKNFTKPCGKILTAGKPYVRDDYFDAEVHDSHAGTTSGAFFFPTHAAQISGSRGAIDVRDIYEQIHIICEALIDRLKDQGVRPYSESMRAFDIFGLDLMVVRKFDKMAGKTIDPCVVLLEVNDRVGYETPESSLTDVFRKDYFEWAWKYGVEPLLEDK